MNTTARSIAAAVTVLALTLSVGAGAVLAADPSVGTLGARVAGYVVADENPAAFVINKGTVTTTFEATAPDGWAVTPASITLEPDATGEFVLTGSGDAGFMTIVGYATELAAGNDTTRIEFGSIRIMQTRPFDPSRYAGQVGLALLIITGGGLLLRRYKPWKWRIVTQPSPPPAA